MNITEKMLPKLQAMEKIKNGYKGELTPMTSCYNWVGSVIRNNPGKLDNFVVALYGLPGKDLYAHAAIEYPDGKVVTEQPGMPKSFRNKDGYLNRDDFSRQVIPMKSMENQLKESSDNYVIHVFNSSRKPPTYHLTESDKRIDELFSGSSVYEFSYDQGSKYCDYQFIVPGETGDNDPQRYVIDCNFTCWKPNEWSVEFSDAMGHKANNKNNGKQFKILNTIVAIVEDFLSRNQNVSLKFSGKLGQGNILQGQIYSLMIKKLSNKLQSYGYETIQSDNDGQREFVIRPNNINETIQINELMNGDILPYNEKNGFYKFSANNQNYQVYDLYNEFFFEVGENHSTEPTNINNGSQYKIISTVFYIMKEIVKKKPNENSWSFSGSIKITSGKISGLGKMYHMICRKDFTPWMVKNNFVAYHDLNSKEEYSFIYTKKDEFDRILHDDPESLQHIDINQLYGYNKEKFKSLLG